jgi:hypothetical protein
VYQEAQGPVRAPVFVAFVAFVAVVVRQMRC